MVFVKTDNVRLERGLSSAFGFGETSLGGRGARESADFGTHELRAVSVPGRSSRFRPLHRRRGRGLRPLHLGALGKREVASARASPRPVIPLAMASAFTVVSGTCVASG
eukprot:3699026-Prymnesium_polylepis.1